MSAATLDYVTATFGGRDRTFRIGPRALSWFEMLHGSAMATLRRFTAGTWTVADLKAVLAAGHPLRNGRAAAEIDATLARNRPGTYAALATMILLAALSGLPENAAHFDEAAE